MFGNLLYICLNGSLQITIFNLFAISTLVLLFSLLILLAMSLITNKGKYRKVQKILVKMTAVLLLLSVGLYYIGPSSKYAQSTSCQYKPDYDLNTLQEE